MIEIKETINKLDSLFKDPHPGNMLWRIDFKSLIDKLLKQIFTMESNIKLTASEIGIITNALNYFWYDANKQLEDNSVLMDNGEKRPLGDIEKKLFEDQREKTFPLLRRFEEM